MDDDFSRDHRRSPFSHPGFWSGMAAGLVLILLHTVLFILFSGRSISDSIGWVIQIAAYFIAASSAAESAYQGYLIRGAGSSQIEGAAVGAALVASLVVWGYRLVRAVVIDSLNMIVVVDPIGVCGLIILDVILAAGIGKLIGDKVKRKHSGSEFE